jgi:hypothetical protein
MENKQEVCVRIKEIGILPAMRVPSAEDALLAVAAPRAISVQKYDVTFRTAVVDGYLRSR